MFKKDKETAMTQKQAEPGTTLIAPNCELAGDLHFSDELLVDGTIKGNVYAQAGSKATIRISEKGRVKGEIRVPNVIVNGTVEGDIRSDHHIELAAKAQVVGNVYYNLIEMVKGSRVDGQLVHLQDEKHGSLKVDGEKKADEEASVNVAPVKSQSA